MLAPQERLIAVGFTFVPESDWPEFMNWVELTVKLRGRCYVTTDLHVVSPAEDDGLDLVVLLLGDIPLTHLIRQSMRSSFIVVTPNGRTYPAYALPDDLDPVWKTAVIYTAAHAIYDKPTKAVADYFRISRDAAAHRVKRARKAGYLPPTTPGKAS